MATKIQFRRGRTGEWSSANPILAQGELGYDVSFKKFKIGDGETAWNSLQYFQSAAADSDWILRQFSTVEDIKQLIKTNAPDSDWVTRQVVLGNLDSDQLQAAVDQIVDFRLGNEIIDSDWVNRQIFSSNISQVEFTDSDWVLKMIDEEIKDLRAAVENRTDSDWVLRQIGNPDLTGVKVDSDWTLRQIANPDLTGVKVDSDWVIRQIANPANMDIQHDSEWLRSTFQDQLDYDSDMLDVEERFIRIESQRPLDSDWVSTNLRTTLKTSQAADDYVLGWRNGDFFWDSEVKAFEITTAGFDYAAQNFAVVSGKAYISQHGLVTTINDWQGAASDWDLSGQDIKYVYQVPGGPLDIKFSGGFRIGAGQTMTKSLFVEQVSNATISKPTSVTIDSEVILVRYLGGNEFVITPGGIDVYTFVVTRIQDTGNVAADFKIFASQTSYA